MKRTRRPETMLNKLENINDKYLHVAVLIFVIVPFLFPLNLPIPVTAQTRNVYNKISSLKAGDVVLYMAELMPQDQASNAGQAIAMLNHVSSIKGVKIVVVCFMYSVGITYFEDYLLPRTKFKEYGLVYGQDWVNLGWITGVEMGMASFAANIQGTVSTDYYGTPLEKIPMMKNIKSAKDIALIIDFTEVDQVIRQFNTPYKTPIILGGRAVMMPAQIPYVATGQLVGILNDMAGGAEYERLMGVRGMSSGFLDSLGMAQILVLMIVLLSNIIYLWNHSLKRSSAEVQKL